MGSPVLSFALPVAGEQVVKGPPSLLLERFRLN